MTAIKAKAENNDSRSSNRFAGLFLSALALAEVIISLAACLCLSAWTAPPANAQGNVGEADNLLTEDKYKEAEDAYRSLTADDQTGDAYAGLSVSLAKQNYPAKILEAEKVLRKAKATFPDNPNLMAAGGYVSFVHSRTIASPAKRDQYLEAAETLCQRAVHSNPDILIAQQSLGLIKLAEDDVEDAIPPLRKSVELADNPVNDTLLAQALLKLDPKDSEAPDLVDKALAMDKNYYPARLQKAVVLLNKGKAEDAFMEMHNIPQSARGSDFSLVEGQIYHKQGDGPAALASWREAIRLEPHSPDAYKNLAQYYAVRGDGEMGIANLHDALELLPNDMALRRQLAELALRQDKLDVAEGEYKTVLASQPDDPEAMLGLSRVYFRRARKDGQYPPGFQQLMDQLQNVVTQQTVQAKVVKNGTASLQENIELNEGEKALAQNHFREARQHFDTVIKSHKSNAYELLTLGDQAYYDGDLHSAEEAFGFAREIPEVASRADQGISKIQGQRNEAARQTKLGDATRSMPEVAVDHYKQALIADPQYPNAYYGLFSVYTKDRKTADPRQAVNYALCFLEAADDANPNRHEVESSIEKLKKDVDRDKRK